MTFRMQVTIAASIVSILAVISIGYIAFTWNEQTTDDAQIDGLIYPIAPRINGFVSNVLIEDNQYVTAGTPLIQLDPTQYQANLATAKAAEIAQLQKAPLEETRTIFQLQSAEAEIQSAIGRISQAQQQVAVAKFQLAQAKAEYTLRELTYIRYKQLVAQDIISTQDFDQARSDRDSSQASVEAASSNVKAAEKALKVAMEQEPEAKARLGLAETGNLEARIQLIQAQAQAAKARLARLQLAWTTIRAPIDGYIANKQVEHGATVTRGQRLMSIVPRSPKAKWVTANYKETQIRKMREGNYCTISVDSYPDMKLEGYVESLTAGTGSVFSLFPPENATGNYVKVVQRIPVRIRLTNYDPNTMPLLRNGMSVEPTVYTNKLSTHAPAYLRRMQSPHSPVQSPTGKPQDQPDTHYPSFIPPIEPDAGFSIDSQTPDTPLPSKKAAPVLPELPAPFPPDTYQPVIPEPDATPRPSKEQPETSKPLSLSSISTMPTKYPMHTHPPKHHAPNQQPKRAQRVPFPLNHSARFDTGS